MARLEGLQVSLTGGKDKIAQIDLTHQRKSTATELGFPVFGQVTGRSSAPTPDRAITSLRDDPGQNQ
jgi:hypothetical protein